jgi:opacity protein-like surface antigen
MKKIVTILAASLSLALVAGAADVPKTEAFIGYDFVRFNPDSNFIPSLNANGGSGQFVWNFYKGFGVAFDGGAVTKGIINGLDVDTTVAHFVAGPRYAFYNSSRFTPFVEALFGGAYTTTSTEISAVPVLNPLVTGAVTDLNLPVSARLVASRTSFAMLTGGGFDWKLSKHVSIRRRQREQE